METPAAVPAARAWPALLVDVVLVPGLPAALLFAVSVGWVLGPIVGAVVIAVVLVIERGTPYPVRREIVGVATMLYAVLALLGIQFGTVLSCSEPDHSSWAYAAAAAVFVGLAALSLWKRFLWGIPIAVLLALVVFFAVYAKLPGIPLDCSGSD